MTPNAQGEFGIEIKDESVTYARESVIEDPMVEDL